MLIGGVVATSVVSSALAQSGHVVWPSLWLFEKDASELVLAAIPACLLVALLGCFVNLSLFSSAEKRNKPCHRLSIAGLMVATTAIFGTNVWKSHVDLKHEVRLSASSGIEPNVAATRLQTIKDMAIWSPVLASLMICGRWFGVSRVRCVVLVLLAVTVGAIARSPHSSPVLVAAAAFLLCTTHISVNVATARAVQHRRLGSDPVSGLCSCSRDY